MRAARSELFRFLILGVFVAAGDVMPHAGITKSPYLKISSSNPDVIEIDQKSGAFIGKKRGHSIIRFSFSEASSAAHGVVKEKDESWPR